MEKRTLTFFVGPAVDGKVPLVYLHTDRLPLDQFGTKDAPRVSDVEFDTSTQEWVAKLKDGTEIFRNKNRELLVESEGAVIDQRFARGEAIPGGFIPEEFVKPQWEHGCPSCRFLGTFTTFDLYWCGITRDVVVKYGNKPELVLIPADTAKKHFPQDQIEEVYQIARERAQRKGLCPSKP